MCIHGSHLIIMLQKGKAHSLNIDLTLLISYINNFFFLPAVLATKSRRFREVSAIDRKCKMHLAHISRIPESLHPHTKYRYQ